MSVITADILLTNARRDEVFTWLGNPKNHPSFLKKVFPGFKETTEKSFVITIEAGFKKRIFSYTFEKKDTSHSGRRIKIKTSGYKIRRCD